MVVLLYTEGTCIFQSYFSLTLFLYNLILGTPGTIRFEKNLNNVNKSQDNIYINISRYHGTIGEVSINLQYIDITSKFGLNYTGKGQIKFQHGQTRKVLKLPLFELDGNEGDVLFGIKLNDPEGGAKVDKIIETKIGKL